MTGRFIAVVGPSGVGKDSVMDAMCHALPALHRARRTITRAQDAGGETFDTVSTADFETLRANGHFALDWSAHGLSYAIPNSVDAELNAGRDVLANVSRSVLTALPGRFDRVAVLSLAADTAVLQRRLEQRGRETGADIQRRLSRPAAPLPKHLPVYHLDNSSALRDTVTAALDLLYPPHPIASCDTDKSVAQP